MVVVATKLRSKGEQVSASHAIKLTKSYLLAKVVNPKEANPDKIKKEIYAEIRKNC